MNKFLFSIAFIIMWMFAPAVYAADAITTGTVNLRKGPGVHYAKRGVVPLGSRLNIRLCKSNWCQVDSRKGTGWVSSRFLAFNQGKMATRYRSSSPMVVMAFTINSYPQPYYYRSYHHRYRYRTFYHRRHHGAMRHHRYYHHRFGR